MPAPERPTRYYSGLEDDGGVTRAQLKRLSAARQTPYIKNWFLSLFQDPANDTPFESREGGYQWIWGGPYDATEQLEAEFGGLVPFERLEAIANDLQDEEGVYDWAPSLSHPDRQDARDEYDDRGIEEELGSPPPLTLEERLSMIEQMLQTGIRPAFGGEEERALRAAAIEQTRGLQAAIDTAVPQFHAMMGHNNPPSSEDDADPQTKADLEERIKKAGEAATTVSQQLARDEADPQLVAESAFTLLDVAKFIGGVIAGKLVEKAFEKALDAVPAVVAHIEPMVTTVVQWLELITFTM